MVTGDYHHTAIAVARGVGMLPPGGELIIIQAKSELQSTAQSLDQPFLASRSFKGSQYAPYPALSSPRTPSNPGSRDPSLDMARGVPAGRVPGSQDQSFTHTSDGHGSAGMLKSGPKQATPHVSFLATETPSPEPKLAIAHPSPSCTYPATAAPTPPSAPPHLSSPHRLSSLTHQLHLSEQQQQHHHPQQDPQQDPQQRASHHLSLVDQSSQWLSSQQRLAQQQSETRTPLFHLQQHEEEESGLSQQESAQMQTTQQSAQMQTTHESAQMRVTQESAQTQGTQEVMSELCEGLVFMQQSEDHVEELNHQQAITCLAQVPDSAT